MSFMGLTGCLCCNLVVHALGRNRFGKTAYFNICLTRFTASASTMLAIMHAAQPTLRLYFGNKNRQDLPITDLLYMQSEANYTWLVWRNGDRVLMPRTMKYFEAQLPTGQFVRIHRHYAINTQHINCVEWAPNQLTVRLSNDECLAVARRKLASVRARLRHYISRGRAGSSAD